ncbi:uncharacterized protein PHACADRAFT_214714 [Phanerochaete carnosa HHB-10118-sp]|uniref:Uncharacterized protein n=1 Tax=Phanerochaete carnosa (strain HHB-10118-sp) TaxID=650164 RepID=K5WEQ2_PHACS|nr:uncharacterized protein PHACADRAFT_214714 [Phanerochaete carnosa HHB-10118-sp]EKM48652.1 hypothetical protein PHACADRAFT_214714 [Phanerochaete carnosa HHB-10118-sp]
MAISAGTKRAIFDVVLFAASQAALYYTIRWVVQSMNPVEKKEVKEKSLKALERLGHKSLALDDYERQIASEIIHPDDIDVHFSGICLKKLAMFSFDSFCQTLVAWTL